MDRDQGRDDFALEPLRLVAPSDFEGRPVPARQWIWEGYVPVGAVTALYGDGGTGKSPLAQQFMTAVATGRLFLEQEVAHVRALGVFCEDDEDELQRRQAAINLALKISFAALGDMRWISRVGSENLLMTFGADGRGVSTPFFDQIVNASRAFGARVVIIDTAADTFAGNENIRTQVRQFISLLSRLAREIGGAVILLAHPSQTGKVTGSGDGGSTAWNNSVRSRLYFHRPGQPDAAKGRNAKGQNEDDEAPDADARILSRLKANYSAAGVDLALRYDRGAFVLASDASGHARGPERDREAEKAFLSSLAQLDALNMNCNIHKGQPNYAPKAMREMTEAGAAFSEVELSRAMIRLIKTKRIASVKEGPPSHQRSRLRVIAPDLPET
jgi:RecA-family ATPase